VRLRLDPSSSVPLSAQLRAAVAARIESGRPGPGERLPPVRALADELGLAPNTVARAYRELEAAGYLVGRGRHGTFVADRPPGAADAALDAAARVFAERCARLGVPPARALGAVRRALEARRPT
jgi:DNA-binding transcriptional regulator YhcF (GntR family)